MGSAGVRISAISGTLGLDWPYTCTVPSDGILSCVRGGLAEGSRRRPPERARGARGGAPRPLPPLPALPLSLHHWSSPSLGPLRGDGGADGRARRARGGARRGDVARPRRAQGRRAAARRAAVHARPPRAAAAGGVRGGARDGDAPDRGHHAKKSLRRRVGQRGRRRVGARRPARGG